MVIKFHLFSFNKHCIYLLSLTPIPDKRTLMSWVMSLSWELWPMPELAEVRSNLWRLLVRLPPGLTGLLFLGDLLTLCGDLSLRGELWRLLPMPEVLWPECWLPARIRNEDFPCLA